MPRVRTTSARQALAELLGPDPTDPVASKLYDSQRAFIGFQQAANDARRDRDTAIKRAVADGYPIKRIREVTGLSAGRISQITSSKGARHGS